MTRKAQKIFGVISLFTGIALTSQLAMAAAFQFGGLRLDAIKVTSSGSATALTKSDRQVRITTGSANDTQKLPNATTLQAGYWYHFLNESSGTLTISNSASTQLTTLANGESAFVVVTSTATAGGPWSIYKAVASSSGSGGGGCAVLTKTTDYTLVSGDFTNKCVTVEMNCSSPCALTLPLSSAVSGYEADTINIGMAQETVTLSGSDTFGSTAETAWIIPPGGAPQTSSVFKANGGSRWNGL